MEIKVAENDAKERVDRVEHVFKIVQLAAENQHSKLSVSQENHQEDDDEGSQVTKTGKFCARNREDSRAASTKSFGKNSCALEVSEELVQLDPGKKSDDGEEIVELILPEDKVRQVAVIFCLRIAAAYFIRVDDCVLDQFENDDSDRKDQIEELRSKSKMLEETSKSENFHFVHFLAKVIADQD